MKRRAIAGTAEVYEMESRIRESRDGDQTVPASTIKSALNVEEHSALVARNVDSSEDDFASVDSDWNPDQRLSDDKGSTKSNCMRQYLKRFTVCPVSEDILTHDVGIPIEVTEVECVSDNQEPKDVVQQEKEEDEEGDYVPTPTKECAEPLYELPKDGGKKTVKYATVLPDNVYDVPRKRCGVHGQNDESKDSVSGYDEKLMSLEKTAADEEESYRIKLWKFLWSLLCAIIILALIFYAYVMSSLIYKARRRFNELFRQPPDF